MLKRNALIIFFTILIIPFIYPAVTSVTMNLTAANTLYPVDTNKLVFRFDILGTADTLNSLEVQNNSTADQPADISSVKAWYQPAGGVFDPGNAVYVGTLAQSASKDWINPSLNQPVVNGSSIYITVDMAVTPTDGHQCKFKIAKSFITFSSGGPFPTAIMQNTAFQTISNPGYLLVSMTDKMPAKADAGQTGVYSAQMTFYNSTIGTSTNITSVNMQSVNYAGGIPMNGSLARITIKDAGTTYANFTPILVSNTANVPLTTALTIPPNGVSKTVDVYVDLLNTINTYDIGIRIPQGQDILNSAGYTVIAYTGSGFPFATSRAVISQATNTVNASYTTLMPANVTKGQANIKPFVLRFTHPQSITTYADCVIKGITITAMAIDGANANSMFSGMRISDGGTIFSGTPVFSSSSGLAWVPFAQNLTITANTYKEVTVLADIKLSITSASFYMSLSKSADVWATDGSSGNTIAISMATSLTSTTAVIQNPITDAGVHHTNRMPASAAKAQTWVYASDFVFTHPDSSGNAAIEIKGITLNVEDYYGTGIAPSTILSKITVLDASNNTLLSYSAIPSTGSQVFLNFAPSLVIQPSNSAAIKVYMDISAGSLTGSYVKFNLNAASYVNAVDFNTKLSVTVLNDSGDFFAMKTTAAQIVDAAVDVKVKHTDIMPPAVNAGQANAGAMLLYFLNNTSGMASVNNIRFRFTDNAGTTIPANSVINNVRIDTLGNTALSYADVSVNTTAATLDLALASPILLNTGAANAVTVTVRFSIANPATKNFFRVSVLTAASITAKDYNLGSAIPAIALNDAFPMNSGITNIQARALTLTVSHTTGAAGPVNKGDPGIQMMDIAFENPGNSLNSSVVITGITLTAENGSGVISANTVFSRLTIFQQGNPANVYGQISSIGTSQFLYCNFTNPLVVTPSASPGNVTLTVSADISSSASQTQFRLNLSAAQYVAAIDSNQGMYVTVTAKAPDVFPDMRSNLINLQAGTKITVIHTNTMPATVTNGQTGVMPFTFQFANSTASTISINGITITVENQSGAGIIPYSILQKISLIDDKGNTDYSTTSIPSSGSTIYLPFSSALNVGPSASDVVSVFVDIANNTYTSIFALDLSRTADVQWLPITANVQADASDSFPMKSGATIVQLKPLQGQISHNDVIPTTVSTGESDIFAEILNLNNPNVTGTADIMLTGITITVEDDTNTVIDPTKALKSIMIKDNTTVYSLFTAMPSVAAPFYLPFSVPIHISVSQTVSASLYVNIVDSLQTGSFRINIKINSDVKFSDANSGNVIPAVPMNGDSFPMTTSTVIIQQAVPWCEVSHNDIIPASVNKGQSGVNLLQLNFHNPGGASGANMAITRLGLYVQDALNKGQTAKNALSSVYIKDGAGTVYAIISAVPDNSDFISIGLTTPINIQPGAVKQIFVTGDINPSALATGFKIDLNKNTDIIARDANSYSILNVQVYSGDSFPDMRSSYTGIQTETTALNLSGGSLMPGTVNKAQANVPVLFLNFTNPNPVGYSTAEITGITITVEDSLGAGITPSSVISQLKATNGGATTYGTNTSVPASGSQVYIPFTTTLPLPAGTSAGVTIYADIAALTPALYLQLDLKQAADITAYDTNSADKISSIAAAFPLRSNYAVIFSTPGIKVLHADSAPPVISTSQAASQAMYLKFTNIGSFTSNVTGITVTVKNQGGTDSNAQALLSALYYVDASANTRAAAVPVAGANVYLDLSSWPIAILPQSYSEGYIYFDAAPATFNAVFYLSIAAPSGVSASAAVSADAGDSFPMNTKNINMQRQTNSIQVSSKDTMPPAVSTGQPGVYVMTLTLENTNPAGYSAALVTGISLTVKDSSGNTQPASSALSGFTITDGTNTYLHVTSTGTSQFLNCTFSQPLTLSAASAVTISCVADITGNTVNPAQSFKFSLAQGGLSGSDYNSVNNGITFTAKASYAFPMDSSATIIQRSANLLTVGSTSVMQAVVSTDQLNVPALNLVLTDSGNTRTASIMLTRLYLYIDDSTNNLPADIIKGIRITSQDGTAVYGETLSFSGNKITVNLTSPIVVSTAGAVTATVRVDIASAYAGNNFRVVLNSVSDMYAVDANSFQPVGTAASTGYIFPMQSNAANIQDKAAGVSLDSFIPLAPAGVTKGQTRVPLFAFRLMNTALAGTANALLTAVTISVKDALNSDMSANSAFQQLYLIDGASNTLSTASATVNNFVPMILTATAGLAGSSYIYVTVFADIPGTAQASVFKAVLQSASMVSVKDVNSAYEVTKTVSPAMPWDSGTAGIFNAPATDLYVWHNSMLPTQVGKGQSKVMAMGLSMFNPGAQGTAEVMFNGVSMTAYDSLGNTLAPNSVFSFVELTDLTGTYFYGGVTASALSTQAPMYIAASAPIPVPASNTYTAYIKVKIASSAAPGNPVKLVIGGTTFMNINNNPLGYVTVTAVNSDNFPMETSLATIISSLNIIAVGHEGLMPVSAVKGQANVHAMKINFTNQSGVDMQVTGITLTVSDRSGDTISASSVLSAVRIADTAGNIIYGSVVPGAQDSVYVDISASVPPFNLAPFIITGFMVSVDIAPAAAAPFYLELKSGLAVATDQPSSIQAASGDYFGNMKSGVVSLQLPVLTNESYHNFPNPFNPDKEPTHIEFYLKNSSEVSARILTLDGMPVRLILDSAVKAAGLHNEDTWAGLNDMNGKVRSGVYLCVLEVKDQVTGGKTKLVKKIVVIR